MIEEILFHGVMDILKITPMLLLIYYFIELVETKASTQFISSIMKYKKLGPIIGALLGLIPQCGFSVIATSFYLKKFISLGTLLAVYIATSDEAIPMLIAQGNNIYLIVQLLVTKVLIAIISGFLIDIFYHSSINSETLEIEVNSRNRKRVSCFKCAIKRTFKISLILMICNIVMSFLLMSFSHLDLLRLNNQNIVIQIFMVGVIGLIPNCVITVTLTQLYVQNLIVFPVLLSGLMTNAGLGLIILFKEADARETIKIISLLLFVSIVSCLSIFFF